ncbi:zinc-ribbon domain-containing protein [Robiginitalea biformata]|uniref:zinc-ribbon domain-containing protein n=1 Tax=Robiginitalea biformata TaxID=252307 RepID=UPI0003233117|nr:zinc-ribbon domain-containing protein [Robiginitalea biformata]
MIIFGLRASNIGSVSVEQSSCSYCQNTATQNITQFGKYFHIFWIPVFPVGKSTFSECVHCKRTIRKKEFSPELKNTYEGSKSQIKRPLWHWAGLIILGLLFAAVSILSTIQ